MPIALGATPINTLALGSTVVASVAIGSSATSSGGAAAAEGYAGEGVHFPAGAALLQDNCQLANTNKITMSLWFAPQVTWTPVVNRTTDRLFGITEQTGEDEYDDVFRVEVATNIPPTNPAGSFLRAIAAGASTATASTDVGSFDESNAYRHLFMTFDTSTTPPVRRIFLDAIEEDVTELGNTPFSIPVSGMNLGFPLSSDAIGVELSDNHFSDVQIWFGLIIDPEDVTSEYSAKAGESRIIRDCVNYMNSRGVSPVEALAAMKIESNYGALSLNYFQFLIQSSFNSILGYTGSRTRPADLNRAFANAWTGIREPAGDTTPNPNNYDGIVSSITSEEPLGWQKFIIHNLGGSAPVPERVSINGYDLLTAWMNDGGATTTLGEIGGLTLMLAQSSIYGSTGPIGAVTSSTTVEDAIGAMITVWNAAETNALTHLEEYQSSNLGYFIDDDGKAVPPEAAADKFGEQTFLFTGNAEDFIENQGTGGAVTLVGTVTTVAGPND